MPDPEREGVVERDKARKALRQTLRSDVEQAKHDLHPRALTTQWTAKQKARLASAGASARQKLAKNAPLVGIGAAAVLLFAARKPISNMIQRLRNGRPSEKGEEQ